MSDIDTDRRSSILAGLSTLTGKPLNKFSDLTPQEVEAVLLQMDAMLKDFVSARRAADLLLRNAVELLRIPPKPLNRNEKYTKDWNAERYALLEQYSKHTGAIK
jgi:hypothetical protein